MARHRRGKSKSARLARLGQLGILKGGKEILEKQNKAVKKQQILVAKEAIEKEQAKLPHSFVIYNGSVGKYIRMLMMDIRKVLEPNTASQLKIQKRNNVKDFIVNGAVLGLSHMIVLTKSDTSVNMRLLKTPQGPTLQFKVNSYTLFRDVIASSKRPVVYEKLMSSSPLLIMNGFAGSDKKELKLVESVLQNLFPELKPEKVLLRNVRRCVLFNYDEESDTISMRHYAIKAVPNDISKSTKKILKDKVPDLSKYKDISEFFLNPGHLSESEFEGEQNEVELAEDLPGKGCLKGMKSNVRMIEIGPRLDLTLTKILEGIDEGEVLYNRYVTKTAEDVKKLRSLAPLLKSRRKKRERIVNVRIVRRLKNLQKAKSQPEPEPEPFHEEELENFV
uniref:Brix domain-containing protein n=1 Tax=Strongyloides stercoralis TaxID=6248 RepID=A0A0K0E1M8_STRER